ncbi:MAG: ABC transporter ATP-binding protein [Candidatus Berkelbacteria bacterium]|nr:ABC transporter ATP-binding protein [Candidatus Berkelbacteria bacterium]
MEKVIEVKKLIKKYDELIAVSGISFEVNRGEIFGLLGENGAGKTTTLEMIEGLRKPSSGKIKVLGFDIQHDLKSIKEKIGVQLQSSAYYKFLKLGEILKLFSGFYNKSVNADELLRIVDLEAKKDQFVLNLSGGQRQRFSIIASLVNDPEIVFLDEPTTGLDPLARHRLWDVIAGIKSKGKTIVLTTHYMEEAEILCDRVAIMDRGKIVVLDETHKLISRAEHPFKINFILGADDEKFISFLSEKFKLKDHISRFPGKDAHFEIRIASQKELNEILTEIQKRAPESLTVGRATLEDLFIQLTGKKLSE